MMGVCEMKLLFIWVIAYMNVIDVGVGPLSLNSGNIWSPAAVAYVISLNTLH